MKPERYRQVKEVFAAAVGCGPDSRAELLARACEGDAELRAEVESLLAHDEAAAGFIEESAFDVTARLLADDESRPPEGGRSGPYRIIREIGRGGMGVVYLGVRDDDHFRKEVAIKLVKRGMDTEAVVRRFRNERQILADLEHPNVARLIDGGATADGRPYLVMEYVGGVPLVQFCDERGLPVGERLRLFLKICDAVNYAHQNLVVHRDLKPSNILVTAGGEPKLLDFGVAKLLNAGPAGEGLTETLGGRVMTPEYASPEQVRGLPVTTASDIYSLGVVLYELLTGERPYRLKDAPPEEWPRLICDTDPSKPSEAVADSKGGSPAPRPAPRPPRPLRGDLDTIVLMAMRKEPARRYASVAQLAEDVRRHLAGLPVVAHEDTFTYRAGKFVRRHKIGLAAAALVLLTLVGGIVATAWQASVARERARVADEQRDRARREAAKAARINSFLQSVISYADPSWYAAGRDRAGEVRFIEVVNGIAARVDGEFADQPEIRAELHHTVGNTYRALGRYEQAVTHFRAARDASRAFYGDEHPKVARDLYYLAAGMQMVSADHASTESLFREAVRMMRATDPENADLPYMLQDLGGFIVQVGDPSSAEPLLREALEMFRRRHGDSHPMVAVSFARLGQLYGVRGDLDAAEAVTREAVEHHRSSSDQQLLAVALLGLGEIQFKKGDYAGSESSLLEALDLMCATLGDSHPHTSLARRSLFTLYEAWRKPERAAQYRTKGRGN